MDTYRDLALEEHPVADLRSARSYIAVVGIDHYRSWNPLHNAVGDANGALRLFTGLGFEVVRPPLLNEDATGDAIRRLVVDDLARLGPEDSLLIFFAGHGHTVTRSFGETSVKDGYLIPVDGDDPEGRAVTWIRLESWLTEVTRIPARHILVILDACYSGIALAPLVKWGSRGMENARREPLAQLRARRSRRIMTSALDDQRARDGGPVPGHSLFTGCLIEAIRGGLAAASGHRVVTGSEIGHYVRRRVSEYPGSAQTPDFGALELDDRGELLVTLAAGADEAPAADDAIAEAAPQPRAIASGRDGAAPASPAENRWGWRPRRALARAAAGCLLGAATVSTLLLAGEYLVPSLSGLDHDVGLRVRRLVRERVTYRDRAMEPDPVAGASDEFVFLDLEPSYAASGSACDALANRPAGRAPVERATLQCGLGRPLNRYLLAELVRGLKDRRPRLLVLDVELGSEADAVPPDEDRALARALAEAYPFRVVFAVPAAATGGGERGTEYVQPDDGFERHYLTAAMPARAARALVRGAVAMPSPGELVRRYPRCYRTPGQGLAPSLPFLAAALSRPIAPDPETLCDLDAADAAPQIDYTLPSLRLYRDDADEEGFRISAVYRRVYARCPADQFWDDGSECGELSAYEGKVVVIGSSNPQRRDLHATALGTMAGAEVVINAIRSFAHGAGEREPGVAARLASEIMVVAACALLWFFYYLLECALPAGWSRASRLAVLLVPCLAALLAAAIVTLSTAFVAFTSIAGALAIVVDRHVEVSSRCIRWVERKLGRS